MDRRRQLAEAKEQAKALEFNAYEKTADEIDARLVELQKKMDPNTKITITDPLTGETTKKTQQQIFSDGLALVEYDVKEYRKQRMIELLDETELMVEGNSEKLKQEQNARRARQEAISRHRDATYQPPPDQWPYLPPGQRPYSSPGSQPYSPPGSYYPSPPQGQHSQLGASAPGGYGMPPQGYYPQQGQGWNGQRLPPPPQQYFHAQQGQQRSPGYTNETLEAANTLAAMGALNNLSIAEKNA